MLFLKFETPPQPEGPGCCIYFPQEQGGPVIPQILGLSLSLSQSHVRTDGQSVSMSWCRINSGTCDQILLSV
jgi:hypothetical protein